MKFALKILKGFEDWASGLLVFSGLMIMFYSVVIRYVFSLPTTWQDEVSRTLLVWGILIGLSAVLREGNHIKVTIIYERLPKVGKFILDMLSNVIILIFSSFLLYSSIQLVTKTFISGQQSLNKYPLWIIYLVLPLISLLLIIRIIQSMVLVIKGEEVSKENTLLNPEFPDNKEE